MRRVTRRHKLYAVLLVMFSVAFTSSLSLFGGLGIELVGDKLLPIVPLVIILPALNSLVGDYATLIAAHAGSPAERNTTKMELVRAILPSVVFSCLFIIGTGLLLASGRNYALDMGFVVTFCAFVVTSTVLVISAMFFLTVVLDKALESSELNPDDVLIPIATALADVLMLGLIALAAVYVF